MRTLVDIPDADLRALDALAQRARRSRAAEIRAAVAGHLRGRGTDQVDQAWIDEGYGYWQHRDDVGDGVDYQRAARADREPD